MNSSESCETRIFRGILGELQDKQSCLHDLARKVEDGGECYSAETKLQCTHAQSKYANLKLDFNTLQSMFKLLNYLENVPMEEWSTASIPDDEAKQTHQNLKKIKGEVRDVQKQLQELIEYANTAQDEFDNQLKVLQSKLEGTEHKCKRLSDLKTDCSSRLNSLNIQDGMNTGNFDEQLLKQKAALAKAESMLATYQDVATGVQREISQLELAKQNMKALLREVAPKLEKLKRNREAEINRQQSMTTLCRNALEKLTHLTGIKEHSIHGDTLTFELSSPGDGAVVALLKMHFKNGPHPYSPRRLKHAELNIESLDIADITEEAVRLNDIVFLVTQVKTRLYSHAPLRHEIEALRKRYALDWLSDEGVVKVMLGDQGQVVCSLTIESGYPETGSIKLTTIEGLTKQTTLDSIKLEPDTDYPTITNWLDYLHDKVTSG